MGDKKITRTYAAIVPPPPPPPPPAPNPWLKDNWGWLAAIGLVLAALILVL
jgi:hypothetical protein